MHGLIDVILPCLDEAQALPGVIRALPPGFRALVVDKEGQGTTTGIRDWSMNQLMPGEVTIAVEYSSINFKDGRYLWWHIGRGKAGVDNDRIADVIDIVGHRIRIGVSVR